MALAEQNLSSSPSMTTRVPLSGDTHKLNTSAGIALSPSCAERMLAVARVLSHKKQTRKGKMERAHSELQELCPGVLNLPLCF